MVPGVLEEMSGTGEVVQGCGGNTLGQQPMQRDHHCTAHDSPVPIPHTKPTPR